MSASDATLTTGDIVSDYVLKRILGTGSFGSVWLGEDTLSRQLTALKICSKVDSKNRAAEYARNEAAVMTKVNHPHNLPVKRFIETDKHCIMVMPFLEGGDMLCWLRTQRKLPEGMARFLFTKVASAVQHTHSAGFIHRDIKLENILLSVSADHPYLADWGFAGPYEQDVLQNKALGSLHYSAPEICRGSFYVGPEVDVWSLGVVLYAMVCGKLPFRGSQHHTTQEEILIASPQYPLEMSSELKTLLKSMLDPDRSLRATMDEVLDSEWIKNGIMRRTSAPSVIGNKLNREGSRSLRGLHTTIIRTASPLALSAEPADIKDMTEEKKKERVHITLSGLQLDQRSKSPSPKPISPVMSRGIPSGTNERHVLDSPPPSPGSFLTRYLPKRLRKGPSV